MPSLNNKSDPRIGLLADSAAQLKALKDILNQIGYEVGASVNVQSASIPGPGGIDVWVVRIEEHSDQADALLSWLNDQDAPMLIDDGDHFQNLREKTNNPSPSLAVSSSGETNEHSPIQIGEYARWLTTKIDACVANAKDKLGGIRQPDYVWVLAASTGGPEAVGQFFQHLGNAAQTCAYIYAQHTDERALQALISVVRKQSALEVEPCYSGQTIEAGHVYVASPEKAFNINGSKQFVVSGQPWQGRYSPSINQVIARVARAYKERSGAIIFTGMGNDGSDAVRLMRAAGGTVFVQSAESCVVDSMPVSAQKSGCVDFESDVEGLATQVDKLNSDALSATR